MRIVGLESRWPWKPFQDLWWEHPLSGSFGSSLLPSPLPPHLFSWFNFTPPLPAVETAGTFSQKILFFNIRERKVASVFSDYKFTSLNILFISPAWLQLRTDLTIQEFDKVTFGVLGMLGCQLFRTGFHKVYDNLFSSVTRRKDCHWTLQCVHRVCGAVEWLMSVVFVQRLGYNLKKEALKMWHRRGRATNASCSPITKLVKLQNKLLAVFFFLRIEWKKPHKCERLKSIKYFMLEEE